MNRNPLALDGTAMPPNLLLMAKVLAVVFLLSGQWALLPERFLPFFGVLDDLGSPALFRIALQVVFLVAAARLLMNSTPRASSFVLGAVILSGMLASRQYVENNRFYTALLFLLAGLSDRRSGAVLIRWQVVVMYFGAALNKLLDADWRSGEYFEHLASLSGAAHPYALLSGLFPPLVLSALLAWTVILTEFGLVAAFLAPRLFGVGIWVGVAYHSGLVLLTGTTFGMFWYAAPASYLAFVQWPTRLHVAYGPASRWSRLRRLLERVDPERIVSWEPAGAPGLRVASDTTTYRGPAALVRLALALPATYLAFGALAALPMVSHRLAALPVLLLLAAVAGQTVRPTGRPVDASRRAYAA